MRRFSDFLGVGVGSSGVRTGVIVGVGCWAMGGWRLDAALSWNRELKSRIRLVVDDGVRRFKLPDVVSGKEETFISLILDMPTVCVSIKVSSNMQNKIQF